MYSITSFIPFWYCDKSIALGNEGQNLTFGGAHLFNKLEIEHPKTCFEANSGYIYIEYNRFLIWYESFVLIVTWSMRVECLPSNRSRSLNLPASKMIQMHPLIKISIFYFYTIQIRRRGCNLYQDRKSPSSDEFIPTQNQINFWMINFTIVHSKGIISSFFEPMIGSRRWNWKFREKHFWNPNPELLLHSSYSFWP